MAGEDRLDEAAELFEEFTGHPAETVDVVDVPNYDVAVKIGPCLGIMYQATRDGVTEDYLHQFRKSSRPTFCVSEDGQQIMLVGGSYLFKDDGINDV